VTDPRLGNMPCCVLVSRNHALGRVGHALPPCPARTPCMRGTVVYHEEILACQKTSKQMAGNRKSASTCFRAGLARMEVAMVYIFGMATRQLTPWSIMGGRCEKRCVQASKQGERLQRAGSRLPATGVFWRCQAAMRSGGNQPHWPTHTTSTASMSCGRTCAASIDTFARPRRTIGGASASLRFPAERDGGSVGRLLPDAWYG
jgi:hypothetical protein